MNIADTSNNGTARETINSANSPNSEQASCPFYSVLNDENMAVSNLPLLNPATDICEEPEQCESSATEDVQNKPQQDWIAEPDIKQQIQVDSEFQKLLILNEELQTANSNLYGQAQQLKQELAEAEKILQWQKKRSTVTESILNQQAQDLATSQEQIHSLFQQLETARQTVQSQEMFINTHKSQLQISQERVAQLERECTLLQTKYGEQSQDLLYSENTCRELRTRLIRQQRQTLQFKAALEKCLDTTVPNYDTLDDTAHHPHDVTSQSTRFSRKARSLFPHAQPIQPWSAEGGDVVDTFNSVGQHLENSWMQSPSPSVYSLDNSEHIYTLTDLGDLTDVNHIPAPTTEVEDFKDEMADIPTVQESNLDQQLESLIEMFFTSPKSSNPPTVTDAHTHPHPTAEQSWETLPPNPEYEKPQTIIEQPLTTESYPVNDSDISGLKEFSLPLNDQSSVNASVPEKKDTIPENSENHDYWAELPVDDFNLQPLGEYSLDHKSPSPLIYPQRPPKGRKSFASVELPNFPSQVHGQKSHD